MADRERSGLRIVGRGAARRHRSLWSTTVLSISLAAVIAGQGPPPPPPPPPPPNGALVAQPAMTAKGTGLLVGQVVDAEGNRPVPGAIVTLSGAGGARTVIAEGQGRFAFRDVPKGTFSINTTKPGWAPGSYGRRRPEGGSLTVALDEGQRVTDLAIPMWRHASINGTVRDEYGDPMVGVEIRALAKTFRTGDPRWGTASTTTTDDRGMDRLSSLVPIEYTVVLPSSQVASFVAAGHIVGHRMVMISGAGEVINPVLPLLESAIRVGDHLLSSTVPPASDADRNHSYAYRTTFYPSALTSSEATSL